MARQPLGRGLGALLGSEKKEPEAAIPSIEVPAGTSEIDIDLIDPNPEQPRTRFAEQELNDLAASIRANGILQPIVVRKTGSRYQIVAGERRWRAAQRAELRRVPVLVKDIPDDKLLELALVENIQRHELNPIEEAKAYRKLIDSIGLTQDEVAARVGRERSLIATSIRLLKLPDDLQELVSEGRLSLSHGRALLMTEDLRLQRDVAKLVLEKGLSVRATESAVKKAGRAGTARAQPARTTDPNFKVAETKLMRKLSTSVKIIVSPKGTSGKIEIEYYSMDDLDRIYRHIISE
ncbi:MAG: ParB/RepB/Spo0J family partition protein [Chloracidobacterium sp.]|nr:ParB/RepB/Spo0J family partition protein [Chloracidobacterium sp.]MCO5332443.1 ParB/RepB/Spo0J family partition protein [Pyrinomonadaceae bacterium]